tara:strand:- start:889 stop:1626 length:738 start_codon:yes stop_codon:yes gene_type:complete
VLLQEYKVMKGKQRLIFRVVMILIIAGVAYWRRGQGEQVQASEKEPKTVEAQVANPAKKTKSQGAPAAKQPSSKKINGYDKLTGVMLVDHRNNDGDSFIVRAGDREFELRLYYVDAPEKYLSDRYENQRERVAEQAREMGGLTVDEIVEVGLEAKEHTLGLLKGKTFDVYTKWERVYDGERYYGFVKLPGGEFYLSEHLVASGLVRIHTKGETMPDGRSYHQYKAHLEGVEKKAKAADIGVWGLD